MTRFTIPKNQQHPVKDPEPDVLPVNPDKGPVPDLLPNDPDRDGIMTPVPQVSDDYAAA